jgi:hypothetical protein
MVTILCTISGLLAAPYYRQNIPQKRLYALHFCRRCGQEFHPVKHLTDAGSEHFIARDIDDTPTGG